MALASSYDLSFHNYYSSLEIGRNDMFDVISFAKNYQRWTDFGLGSIIYNSL